MEREREWEGDGGGFLYTGILIWVGGGRCRRSGHSRRSSRLMHSIQMLTNPSIFGIIREEVKCK